MSDQLPRDRTTPIPLFTGVIDPGSVGAALNQIATKVNAALAPLAVAKYSPAGPNYYPISDRPGNTPGQSFSTTGIWGATCIGGATFRIAHRAVVPASNLVLCVSNIYGVSGILDSNNNNSLYFKAYFQALGTDVTDQTTPRLPVTFQGQEWVCCPPGGLLFSDPSMFNVTANQRFFVYFMVRANAPDNFTYYSEGLMGGSTYQTCANGDGFVLEDAGTANVTLTSSQAAGASSGYATFPVTVLGYSPTPVKSVGILGDSIAAGNNDYGSRVQGGGYLERALIGLSSLAAFNLSSAVEAARVPMFPYVRRAVPGVTLAGVANTLTAASVSDRILSLCSTVVSNLGTNDLGTSVPAFKANYISLAQRYAARGIKFIALTLLPRTTSSDYFFTASGQTVTANEAARITINTWLRDTSSAGFVQQCGYPGLVDTIDICFNFEVNASNVFTQNGGRFPSAENVGILTGSITAIGGGVTYVDSGQTTTVDQWRGWNWRMTSGAANGQITSVIGNKTGGYFMLANNGFAGVLVGDTYQLLNVHTPDGTHASSHLAWQVAAQLLPQLIAKVI